MAALDHAASGGFGSRLSICESGENKRAPRLTE